MDFEQFFIKEQTDLLKLILDYVNDLDYYYKNFGHEDFSEDYYTNLITQLYVAQMNYFCLEELYTKYSDRRGVDEIKEHFKK